MVQEIKLTDKPMLLMIAAVSGLAALAAFIRVATLKCDEIACLINLFLSIPIGLAIGGLVFFTLFLTLMHARGSKTSLLHFVPAFAFALIFGILTAALFGGLESVASLILIPITLYLKRVWWIFLLVFIGSTICIKFLQSTDFNKRFWTFVVLAGIIPALISSISYPLVMKNLPQAEIEEVHAAQEAQYSIIQLETQRIPYLVESGDPTICDTLKQMRDMCYSEFAAINGDAGLCNKIRKSDWKSACYKGAAYASKNAQICESIDNTGYGTKSDVENCKISVQALQTSNSEQCQGIAYRYSGENTISDTVGIRQCVARIAVDTRDENLCKQIGHDYEQYQCISRIAIIKNDMSLCTTSHAFYAGYCYADSALQKNDKLVCENAPSEKVEVFNTIIVPKEQCYDRFFEQNAYRTNDKSLCASITDTKLREGCGYKFGEQEDKLVSST